MSAVHACLTNKEWFTETIGLAALENAESFTKSPH